MSLAQVPPLLVATPLLAAAVVAGSGRWLPRVVADVVTMAVALTACIASGWLLASIDGDREVTWLGDWTPEHGRSVGIVLVADHVAAGLAFVAAALTLACVVYSWRYLEDVASSDHALVLVFLAGVNGFVLTGDLFNTFVWFELLSIAAIALTGLRVEEPRSVQGALTFAIVTSLGATVALLGVALLYADTGELTMAAIGQELRQGGSASVVAVGAACLLSGFLVKAAAVPWHFWTADAEAVAPTPVCVLLSGVLVTTGVYGVARAWWVMFDGVISTALMREVLLCLGTATALVGAVMCVLQRHLKRLLAYSTISHVGLMLIGVGLLGEEGLAAAALYAVGHACAKGALFFGSGVLLNRFETVDEHELYGKGRSMPLTRIIFVVGALGLAGAPAVGVWTGKSLLEHALTSEHLELLNVVLLFVSACTGGAVLRVTLRVFWGLGPVPWDAREEHHEEEPELVRAIGRAPLPMVLPAWTLLAASIALALVPGVRAGAATGAAAFVDVPGYIDAVLRSAAGTAVSPPPAPAVWTTSAVLLGLVAVVAAALVAATAIWAERVPGRLRASVRWLAAAARGLHWVHAGHVGSYVAWGMVGVAGLGAALVH